MIDTDHISQQRDRLIRNYLSTIRQMSDSMIENLHEWYFQANQLGMSGQRDFMGIDRSLPLSGFGSSLNNMSSDYGPTRSSGNWEPR